MRRASWILASLTAVMLAACGDGRDDRGTTGGAEFGEGTGAMTDTTMAPGATPADTATLGGDTLMTDTMRDTAPAP